MKPARDLASPAELQAEPAVLPVQPVGSVIALQQSAGNVAVTGLVSRTPPVSVDLPKPPAEALRHDEAIATGLATVAKARGGELAAWQAAVAAAAAAIVPARLQSVAAAPDALAKAGAEIRAGEGGDGARAGAATGAATASPAPAAPASATASPAPAAPASATATPAAAPATASQTTSPAPTSATASPAADPASPAAASPAGDVAGRLLARAPELARAIVDAAAAKLDPAKRVGELAPLVDRLLPQLQDELTGELQQIAATAAATASDVGAKVAAQQDVAKQEHEQAGQRLTSVADAIAQVVAQAKAIETQQAGAGIAGDLAMLERLKGQLAAHNREAVDAEVARMSAQQRAVLQAFAQSGGTDALGAVAVGLAERIKADRLPALTSTLQETATSELGWETLDALGRAVDPSFSAGPLAREIRASVKGWGTDEKRLFAALGTRTPIQIAAMRKAYKATFDRDMDEDIDDDLSGSEQDRADALRSGDPIAGAVATLRDAMDGAGTDEQLIFQTLRGKSATDRAAIIAAYKDKYGVDLQADLKSEMDDYELGQATALLQGDTVKADAMALKDAMAGAGTDEAGINAVYSRIRDEVESQAQAKGWKTEQVEAEIKRRTGALKSTYDKTFDADLKKDFDSELSGGELDFALAEQDDDRTAMDAATLRTEHMSAWTSDDKVNEVLKAQYLRAKQELTRDGVRGPELEKQAIERSHRYMSELEKRYDATAVTGNFSSLIETETSGYSRDEARERVVSGGHLSDAKELKYAIFGLGTNEQTIRETLKGKSKGELDQLSTEYAAETGNELVDDLKGDLSGRDEADMTRLLQTGDATPEERLNYLKARKQWELGEGTGRTGAAYADEEARVLEATTKEAEAAYATYAQNPDDPKAKERMERWIGYGEKDIDRHREELDSAADRVAMISAIAVGLVVTMATAGAAGPAVAAALGALASTAVSMSVKQDMKGDAYGGEDMAVDIVQGLADAVVQAATAGVGKAALEALAETEAFAVVGRAARGGTLAKFAVKAGESGFEGLVQGVPSGIVSAVLNDGTWQSDDPIGAIVRAGGRAAAHSAAMGAGMGSAAEGVGHALGGGHAAVHEIGGGHEGGGAHETASPGEHALGGADAAPAPPRAEPLREGSVRAGLGEEGSTSAYEQARDHTPDREVAIWEHFDTGEPIVVQGDHASTFIDPEAHPAFDDANYGSRQHYHTIDKATGLTPDESLFPSAGPDGDMGRARSDSRRAKKEWSSRIEVVTKDGHLWVEYGFDPKNVEQPYWVKPPKELGGTGAPERFASEYEYMEWVERQHATRRGEAPPEPEPAPAPPRPPDPPPPASERSTPASDDPEVDDFLAEQRAKLDLPPGRSAAADPAIVQHEVPDDGGASFTDIPTGEFVDEPTIQEIRPDPDLDPDPRDFDDEPTHSDIPLEDLPPGSVMYSDAPLTAAEANSMYLAAIADGNRRLEVMVLRNSRTGERVVIQGERTRVRPDADAWKDFAAEDGKGGRWIPERHYHPVGADGKTPATSRVPSGRGGDMEGAMRVARRGNSRHEEHLDLADEGPIAFGYDPAEAKPYFIRLPGEDYRYFKTLEAYHEWAEGHLGEPLPELKGSGEGRKAAGDEEDEWAPDTDPDVRKLVLPPSPDAKSGEQLLTEYKSADEVWVAARDALKDLKSGMDEANLPADWWAVDQVLSDHPSSVNEEMRELAPIVFEGLHDADLYAEVMADAWSELKAQSDAGQLGERDVNDALIEVAERDGAPIKILPAELGVMDPDPFFREFVGVRAHVVDIGALKGADVHGVMPHIIQDLVVNKALARAGRSETSADFRAKLAQCRGEVSRGDYPNLKYTFSEDKLLVGDFIWQMTYDLTEGQHVNVPEEFRPLLGKLFGVR